MHGHDSGPTRIYAYNARAPLEGGELVRDQMHRAHRYRNALCELERTRRQRADDILRRRVPGLVEVESELTRAEETLENALAEVRAQNAQARRKQATAENRQRLAELRGQLRELRERRRALRGEAFTTPDEVTAARREVARLKLLRGKATGAEKTALATVHEEAVRALAEQIRTWHERVPLQRDLAANDAWKESEAKRLRHESGLHWGTYLTVEQACANFGKGAPPQFRGWRGDGKMAVQLQGGLAVPDALGVDETRLRIEYCEAPLFRNPKAVAPDPSSRRQQRRRQAIVWMRAGSEGRAPVWVRVPVMMDRPLPEDAQIKWAWLVRRRVATHDHWQVQFVLERKVGWEICGRAETGVVGVDLGWRLLADGSLRVAYWVGSDGGQGELTIPAERVGRWDKAESLRSIRDRQFDQVRESLNVWLALRMGRGPEWVAERLAQLNSWKSCGRLAAVVVHWRGNRFPGDEMIFPILEEWRKQDKHLYDWEMHQRRKAVAWRDDHHFRAFARYLAGRYKRLILEDINWREMMARPAAESEEAAIMRARYLQRVAAVGRLAERLRAQFGKRNVTEAEPGWTTLKCSWCGHVNDFDAATAIVQTCSGADCPQKEWDQDENAARNLLASEEMVKERLGGPRDPEMPEQEGDALLAHDQKQGGEE